MATNTVPPTAPPIPTPTAKPTLEAGTYTRDLIVNTLHREYILYIPSGFNNQQPAPVVFVFHGFGGDPLSLMDETGFNQLADKNGFFVVYPRGTSASWNAGGCCGNAIAQNRDETAFVKQILVDLQTFAMIDPERVYATGISNGGMMSYRLACEMSDTFAAIAPVAGPLFYTPCEPQEPVAVMHVHGPKLDSIVPFAGGTSSIRHPDLLMTFPPVEEGISTWVKIDGCTTSTTEEVEYVSVHTVHSSCKSGTAV